MSIYGSPSCSKGEQALSRYAKKAYVDALVSTRLASTGGSLGGNLNMNGHIVGGLPTTYPPVYKGDEAASWGQVTAITTDIVNTAVTRDGHSEMTGNLKMGGHQIKDVLDPVQQQDVATKAYVDSNISYYFKLRCGEEEYARLIFRDFFIPNADTRFGLDKSRLFVHYTVVQTPGDLVPCSIVRLKVDDRYLRIRFALIAPWRDNLSLHTRVDVLSASTNVARLDHKIGVDGRMLDWD
jgi:hypothetical protein